MKRVTLIASRFLAIHVASWLNRVTTAILITSISVSVFAQGTNSNPQDKRSIGVDKSSTPNSKSDRDGQREARPELIIQTGYNNFFGASRLVFSPDGRLLATTTFRSSTVKLWETSTGRELRNLSSDSQSAFGMSPVVVFSRDSRLIAASTGDNAVKVWDVGSGREVQTLAGSQGSFMSAIGMYFIAFGADERTLITASDAIRVWDVTTGRALRELGAGTMNAGSFTGGGGGLALSADGNQLARLVADGSSPQVTIWNITTGQASTVNLSDRGGENVELSFNADGHLLAAGIVDNKLRIWDLNARSRERDLGSTTKDFSLIKFSPDGRILVLSEGYTVRLWDVGSGRESPVLNIPNNGLFPALNSVFVGLSNDGLKLATGGFGTQTILWETITGKQLVQMKGRSNPAYEVAFNADGTQLFSGGHTRWDLRSGSGLRMTSGVAGPSQQQLGLASPDGRLLAGFNPSSSSVKLIETETGRELQTLAPAGDGVVQRIWFSPDSRLIVAAYMQRPGAQANMPVDRSATRDAMKAAQKDPAAAMNIYNQAMMQSGSLENQIKLWDVSSGKELHSLPVGAATEDIRFSSDGKTMATLEGQGTITLWDVDSGSRLRDLSATPSQSGGQFGSFANIMQAARKGSMPNVADINSLMTNALGAMAAGTMGRSVTSLAFSPDGQIIAAGGVESKSNLDQMTSMAIATGQKRAKSKSKQPLDTAELMKNFKVETTGRVILLDAKSGLEVGRLTGHGKGVTHVAFSRDGRLLASSASDNTIKIWDVASRRELRTLSGHTANIESLAFSPDARLLASAGDDGGTFLWDASTGEHLLTLISIDDGGEWMVVTPEGLFDGTPVSWNQILWRYNGDTFNVAPIEWFFTEFYYPGLLSDVFAGKRPHVAQDVSKKDRRQPTVKLTLADGQTASASAVAQRTVKVRLDVADAPADKDHTQGCGARDVRLFRNGSLIKVWHGDVLNGKSSATLEEEITVVAGENRLLAYGFNRDNVKSKDVPLVTKGAGSLKRAGTAYVLAVGINQYQNSQYNLKYAVADANSFAEAVRARQEQLGQFDRVEVLPLLDRDATKANILAALKRMINGSSAPPSLKANAAQGVNRVQPEDAVIIYFAGHGTAQGQRFYLVPHDLGYTGDRAKLSEAGLQTILAHSISDVELEHAIEGLDAGHLLFVINACNSGQALEAEEKRRGPMNSKGLAQLAYEKGMYILTAAQSYQAALEAAQLGHGLLTYALVEEGLKTQLADTAPKDGMISAREWLDFATLRVPQMQEEKMRQARGLGLAFAEGEQNIADPQKRSVQRPRVFYRRELEVTPFVIAKPAAH